MRLSPTVIALIAGVLAVLLIAFVFAGGSSGGKKNPDRLSDQQVGARPATEPESRAEVVAPAPNADQDLSPGSTSQPPSSPRPEPAAPEPTVVAREASPAVVTREVTPAVPQRPRTTASPSFNCRRARTRGEIAVCGDAGLASLDRQMASQFNRSVSRGTAEQRTQLQRTRGRFLARRDSCRSTACMAEAYRARMKEIAAISAGSAPQSPAAPTQQRVVTPNIPQPPSTATGPSFNCRYARTRGEVAVCQDSGLASLDRQMAGNFSVAMARGTPAQREVLQRTRSRFVKYRDSCRSKSCVAASYRSRLNEIADIMAGRWKVY